MIAVGQPHAARRALLGAVLALCGLGMFSATRAQERTSWANDGRTVVSIAHDAFLASGENAESVVSVFGSADSAGTVSDSVVAVFGDARSSGSVGDSIVSVLGDVYVDGKVDGTVVSVLGNVQLGPRAEVGGGVVDIFGTLERSPSAIVHGGVERIFSTSFTPGLHSWLRSALLYGRLLSFDPGARWAWGFALALLALYVLLAALFPEAVTHGVDTLTRHPGESLLAAILALLVSPLLFVVLAITVIGVALVPIVWFCVSVFGKVVALGWIGSRVLAVPAREGQAHVARQPALAVLIGGAIVLLLYLIPLLGLFIYALLGALGFGAVVYACILALRNSGAREVPTAEAVRAAAAARAAEAAGSAEAARSAEAAAAAAAAANASTAGPVADAPPADSTGVAPSPVLELTLPRAGFWIRMGALLIDALLIGIIVHVLRNGDDQGGLLLLLPLYGAIMWKLKSTTVGGAVCHLKVVRLDGRPIDWGTAVVRALGCLLSLAVAGLGFFWIAVDPQRQAWHDKIAGTVVVRVPEAVPLL
jgi:uncharacterized RDD family membrane protein YckC